MAPQQAEKSWWEIGAKPSEVNDAGAEEFRQRWPKTCVIPGYKEMQKMSIVYTWVNGSEPIYQQTRIKNGGEVGGSRDRDIGELKYSLRALYKYASWITGDIFIVTPNGQKPSWMDAEHPRIKFIDQDSLFPDYAQKYLPMYNTHVLEQFLYRIPGLSETFLHFNDDYMLASELTPHDLFSCKGDLRFFTDPEIIPHRQIDYENDKVWFSSVIHTQWLLSQRQGVKTRRCLKHGPFLYNRKALSMLQEQEWKQDLRLTLQSRFREPTNINLPLLYVYFMVEQSKKHAALPNATFATTKEGEQFILYKLRDNRTMQMDRFFENILTKRLNPKLVALNDDYTDPAVADQVLSFLNVYLPEKSPYELGYTAPVPTHAPQRLPSFQDSMSMMWMSEEGLAANGSTPLLTSTSRDLNWSYNAVWVLLLFFILQTFIVVTLLYRMANGSTPRRKTQPMTNPICPFDIPESFDQRQPLFTRLQATWDGFLALVTGRRGRKAYDKVLAEEKARKADGGFTGMAA